MSPPENAAAPGANTEGNEQFSRRQSTEAPGPVETRCGDCDRIAVEHAKQVDFSYHPNGTSVDRTTEIGLVGLWQDISKAHDEGAKP
jgi:hypothetical protein